MEVILHKMKPMEARLPLLVIGLIEEAVKNPGEMRLTGPLADMAVSVIELGDFKAARGEVALVYSLGRANAERVMYVGFGVKATVDVEGIGLR